MRPLQKSFVFEFAGMPKSGKTTILDIVVHYLKRVGYPVKEYHGGGRYAPIGKSDLDRLNLYLAGKAIEFLLVASAPENVPCQVFMMDRGVFDRRIFTKALLQMGKLDQQEADTLLEYLNLPRFLESLDGIFLFKTTPTLSLERELKNKLVTTSGRVMNSPFLNHLRDASLSEFDVISEEFSQAHLIDTEKFDGQIRDCAQKVADQIVSILHHND